MHIAACCRHPAAHDSWHGWSAAAATLAPNSSTPSIAGIRMVAPFARERDLSTRRHRATPVPARARASRRENPRRGNGAA
jgi:hypothetical protein